VGATRGHNRPRVEARAARSGGGGGSVMNFSKSGLRGGIDSCIDSVMDAGSKGSGSSIYVRMHGIRDAHCRHSDSKCTVGLIEDLVRQVWRIRIQIWRHLLRGPRIKMSAPAPGVPRPGMELDPKSAWPT
jgi:hypothetical protein